MVLKRYRLHRVGGYLLAFGNEVLPRCHLGHVDAGALPDICAVVEHHGGQGVLDAIGLALVAVKRLAGSHKLVHVAALFEAVGKVYQARIAAATQEAAETSLLDVGQIRRADTT